MKVLPIPAWPPWPGVHDERQAVASSFNLLLGRVLLWVLLLAVLGMIWALVYGPKGWWHRQQVQEQIDRVEAENERLYGDILARQQELRTLQSNEAALEEQARQRLGMVRPGEILFIPDLPEQAQPDLEDDSP